MFKFCLKYVSKPFVYIITIENSHLKLRTLTGEFTVYCDILTSIQSTVSRPLHTPRALAALKINLRCRPHYHLWTVISCSFLYQKNLGLSIDELIRIQSDKDMRMKYNTYCWGSSVGKHNFLLIAELKGHKHVANAVIVGVNTCFFSCFSQL